MNRYTPAVKEENKKWILIDAKDLVLGRLASVVANILRGKNKPIYTPNNDCGDNVVIVNAEQVYLSGTKREDKVYYWHTGYPGGIKQRTAAQILSGKFPERVIMKAVQRMIPRGPLGRSVIKKLKIYSGASHPHEAQKVEVLDVAGLNSKNIKR